MTSVCFIPIYFYYKEVNLHSPMFLLETCILATVVLCGIKGAIRDRACPYIAAALFSHFVTWLNSSSLIIQIFMHIIRGSGIKMTVRAIFYTKIIWACNSVAAMYWTFIASYSCACCVKDQVSELSRNVDKDLSHDSNEDSHSYSASKYSPTEVSTDASTISFYL